MSFAAPTTDLIHEVCLKLDQIDLEEIECSTGRFPLEALIEAADLSTVCHVAVDDLSPIGIFGLVKSMVDPRVAFPWGFYTPELRDFPIWLLRDSKRYVQQWQEQFDWLVVYVMSTNERSIQYLDWLGFEFTGGIQPGLHGSTFKEYIRCATQ